MESILTSIKKMLGVAEECEDFDIDIIIHINSALSMAHQLGVGPKEGFSIEDKTATWVDFISAPSLLELVKTYVYLKVKPIFDPPLNSSVLKSYEEQAKEYEFRIIVAVDEKNHLAKEENQNGE